MEMLLINFPSSGAWKVVVLLKVFVFMYLLFVIENFVNDKLVKSSMIFVTKSQSVIILQYSINLCKGG